MPVVRPDDPDDEGDDAKIVAVLALLAALALIGVAVSIGAVHCRPGGVLILSPATGIVAGAVLAVAAAATLAAVWGAGRHALGLTVGVLLLVVDVVLLIVFLRYSHDPQSTCYTF